jgi:PAS domain S-box-containing protein
MSKKLTLEQAEIQIQQLNDIIENLMRQNEELKTDKENLVIKKTKSLGREIIDKTEIQENLQSSKEILDKSEKLYKTLFEFSPAGIMILDLSGKILQANDSICKYLGYSDKELVNSDVRRIVYGNADSIVNNNIEKIYSQDSYSHEVINVRKDGSLCYFELREKKVVLPTGEEVILTVAMDITNRKNFELELVNQKNNAEELNKLKSNFLANISHEIRTPLNGILGFSDILKNELPESEHCDMASDIYDCGKRLLDTLNMIIELSKVEANKYDVVLKKLNVEKEIQRVVKMHIPGGKNKNLYLKVRNNAKTKPLTSILDEKMFSNVINNIVDNAVKYTLKGGVDIEITDGLKDGNNIFAVHVSDTGIGIDKKHLDIIFDEFRQVSEGKSRFFEGTGLGLTVARKFTELMNGTIEVKSELGKGSVFSLYFPVNISADKNYSEIKSNDIKSSFSEPEVPLPKVLYIEDDFLSQEIVRFHLKSLVNLDVAFNPENAENLIRKNNYDLILLDINLGREKSGLEVLNFIRTDSGFKNIPVIAITAYVMKGDKEEFLRKGCDDYIGKPFEKSELINCVKKHLKINAEN